MKLRNGKHVEYVDYNAIKRLKTRVYEEYNANMNLLYFTHTRISHLREYIKCVDSYSNPYYHVGSYLYLIHGLDIPYNFNWNTFTKTQIIEYFKGYSLLCLIEYEYRELELILNIFKKKYRFELPVFVPNQTKTVELIKMLYYRVSKYELYDKDTFLVKKIDCYYDIKNDKTKMRIDVDTYFTNMRRRILELLYGTEMRGLYIIQKKYNVVLPAIYEYLVDNQMVSMSYLFRMYNIVFYVVRPFGSALLEPKVALLEPKVALLVPKVALLVPKVALLLRDLATVTL